MADGVKVSKSSSTPSSHGGTQPVPVEALLSDDFLPWLVRAPLTEGGSCRYEACESDEVCTCQLPEPWTEAQLDSVRRLRYEGDA